jgi:aspartyl-tRNA synthetase
MRCATTAPTADLRIPLKLTELTDLMKAVDFKSFAAADLAGGRVGARYPCPGRSLSRQGRSTTTRRLPPSTAPRGLPIHGQRRGQPNEQGLQSPIVKFASRDALVETFRRRRRQRRPHFLRRRPREKSSATRSVARKVGHERGFATTGWRPLWVVDFPMFEFNDESRDPGRAAPSVHRAERRPRRAFPDRPRQRDREGLRRRPERVGNRRRIGPSIGPTCRLKVFSSLGISVEDQRKNSDSCSTRSTARRTRGVRSA